jgi:hypothetical protein
MAFRMKKNVFAALLGGALFAAMGSASADVLVADSVAEFSGVQGRDSWQYGYEIGNSYTEGGFLQLANYVSTTVWGGTNVWSYPTAFPDSSSSWTALAAFGGHPNGTNTGVGEQLAVRRWVSEVSGPVTLSGVLQNIANGSVLGSIYVDGSKVWSASSDGVADVKSYSVLANVLVGSNVDLVISSNGLDYNDSTKFTAQITAVPEPESYALFLAGLGLMGMVARRKRA